MVILIQARIYNQNLRIKFCIEKCAMLKIKSGKREATEGIELQIKKASERLKKRKITSTWKYWKWIPSTNRKWKTIMTKEYIQGRRNPHDTKPCNRNLIRRVDTLGSPSCKILGTNVKIDKRETLTNGQKDKKVDDGAQGLTSKRWYKQTLCIKKRRWKQTR